MQQQYHTQHLHVDGRMMRSAHACGLLCVVGVWFVIIEIFREIDFIKKKNYARAAMLRMFAPAPLLAPLANELR